jgi:hypothetical protein
MLLPGSARGTLVQVERYEIHEQPNWRLVYRLDGEPESALHEARLAVQSVHADPAPGDRIEIDLVLGEAVAVRRLQP